MAWEGGQNGFLEKKPCSGKVRLATAGVGGLVSGRIEHDPAGWRNHGNDRLNLAAV